MIDHKRRHDDWRHQADVIQAFIAGFVFAMMISMLIAEVAR